MVTEKEKLVVRRKEESGREVEGDFYGPDAQSGIYCCGSYMYLLIPSVLFSLRHNTDWISGTIAGK